MIKTIESTLKYADLFSGLQTEDEILADKKIEVKTDPVLQSGVDYFQNLLESEKLNDQTWGERYEHIASSLHKRYGSKEIEELSLILGRYQGSKKFDPLAGIFLSVLINQSYDKDFVLHTDHLANYPGCIGYCNSKNINVNGNVGGYLGRNMKDGKIIVERNAEDHTGDGMTGGVIDINGDAKNSTGSWMHGGKIIVRGNAGMDTGEIMTSGEITILGNADRELGRLMEGGMIRVYGNTGNNIGFEMKNGEIFISGDSGNNLGYRMRGGKIHLGGKYGCISKENLGGDIYQIGKQIIKDGREIYGADIRWY
jgi:formylmethanofuran dehydrogenase subunit C